MLTILDAVKGIKELITLHPIILRTELNKIIREILPLIMDADGDVRKAVLALLEQLFEQTPAVCHSIHFINTLDSYGTFYSTCYGIHIDWFNSYAPRYASNFYERFGISIEILPSR
jgi:hypothetical protein